MEKITSVTKASPRSTNVTVRQAEVGMLLLNADKAFNNAYDLVLQGANIAKNQKVEFEVGTIITAQMRAEAVRKVFKTQIDAISPRNRSNIQAWFTNALVLHFAPNIKLEIEAKNDKGEKGIKKISVTEALTQPKNVMQNLAKQVRDSQKTKEQISKDDVANAKRETASLKNKPVKASDVSNTLIFRKTLKVEASTPAGLIAINKVLHELGLIIVAIEV